MQGLTVEAWHVPSDRCLCSLLLLFAKSRGILTQPDFLGLPSSHLVLHHITQKLEEYAHSGNIKQEKACDRKHTTEKASDFRN